MAKSFDYSNAAPDPPGVLPKKLHFYALFGIVAIVLIATWVSGERVKKAPDPAASPTGPSASQLSNFQKMLEKQRSESTALSDLLEERHRQEEEMRRLSMQPPAFGAPDPLEENRRVREAAAPFASNIVVKSDAPANTEVDRSPQLVFSAESKPVAESGGTLESAVQPALKESGVLLPAKEGNLFRVYEGTTIETALVNRLEGSFTGPVRTVVTKALLARDNQAVLVPLESLFLGSATRVQEQNQTRLAVAFNRLILPNGYSVDLAAAPGLDRLGETGLKDKVDNHRRRTFGISGAMGLLGGLALYAGRGGPFVSGVANQLGATSAQTLGTLLNTLPTITIREGHSVQVYLPTDLLLPEYTEKGTP